jgi:pyrimidine deaminase RibD-like protein
MLIRTKPPAGQLYPQLIQFPEDYDDFLAAFRGGQTVDNNTYLTTGEAPQTHSYKVAIRNKHLRTEGNPIGGGNLVDIFLTEAGAERILVPQDRPFCQQAFELAKKSIAEDDGELHPYVGAVIVKDGEVISTGYRGETGEGRHAEFCALKNLNDDVDKVDLSGCTVYTTLEPCSERKSPNKIACATRLIKANAARVVSGMPDEDKDVYGLSALLGAGIHIAFFPNDLMQEVYALNKEWSKTRRKPDALPPPNDTDAIATASYQKPGTSMQDNFTLYVRRPKDDEGFYTIEDAAKQVLDYARTLEKISIKWRRINDEKEIEENLVRQGSSNMSGDGRLNLT